MPAWVRDPAHAGRTGRGGGRGDRHTEGLALGNLAKLSGMRGDLPGAIGYLDRLVVLTREQGDTLPDHQGPGSLS